MMASLRRTWILALVGAVLATAGCGGGSAKANGLFLAPPSATATPSNKTLAPPRVNIDAHPAQEGEEEGEEHKEEEHKDNNLGSKYSVSSPPPDGFRAPDAGDSTSGSGRIQLALKITPGCAELGTTVKVVARTKPDVQVRLLTNITNSDNKVQEAQGRSGPDGLFHWLISIPPNHAVGNYNVFAAAADDREDDGGRSGSWLLVVAEPRACP